MEVVGLCNTIIFDSISILMISVQLGQPDMSVC